jgi:uncharacterized protein with ParB-like and HNH nuclease domain
LHKWFLTAFSLKWKEDEVKRLIDDIFYHFEQSYAKHIPGGCVYRRAIA